MSTGIRLNKDTIEKINLIKDIKNLKSADDVIKQLLPSGIEEKTDYVREEPIFGLNSRDPDNQTYNDCFFINLNNTK